MPNESAPPPGRTIWINGELVPWASATVHVLSHSHQRGSLIFDYMSVHETPRGPAVFRMVDHVQRFLRSAELIGFELPRTADAIGAAIVETVRANPGASAVKVSAYLPSIEIDVVPADERVTIAIAAYDPLADIIAKSAAKPHFARVLRVRLERDTRKMRRDIIPPQAKVAANYTSPMIAKWKARRAGYDEILLIDADGHLAEGPTTNVFLVGKDGRLCTPPTGSILEGITRASILAIAKHDGRAVSEAPIAPEALFEAAEVFLTGTTAGVWPVTSVDGRPVGSGDIGPVSQALRERFEAISSGRDADFDHWLTYVGAA
ncbi:MAG: aminotransferase class IV [Deltaproteobacteria bacterium]|nr:MAG: aminotransferase class IV [Deltaproteobacteria bacterium]